MAQFVCRYRKGDEVRWISHLDLKRTLERAMRRAELPLELTEGHNPHPKLSFGPPLPLGATGDAELLALRLREATSPDDVKERLNRQLPAGVEIVETWVVPGHKKKETLGELDVAEYRITVSGCFEGEEIAGRVRKLLACEELLVQRGGKRPEREVDLRPMILSLNVAAAGADGIELHARLQTGSHGGARPQEVVDLLGLGDEEGLVSYRRTGLYASSAVSRPRPGGVWRRWARSRSDPERSASK